MNAEVAKHIKDGFTWNKLPEDIKKIVDNSSTEYNEALVDYSIKNQLRYKTSSVRHVVKNERRYYERLLEYSRQKLLLYPYHLQEKMLGLRVTPFLYYLTMLEEIMSHEKSYDSLPNFTAADALRLLGIGRNQYIAIMNKSRMSKKFRLAAFRKPVSVKDHLPKTPIKINIEPWWTAHVGFIMEEDIRRCSPDMKTCVDQLINDGPTNAGKLDYEILQLLYNRGLIYVQIPVQGDDRVSVPPLEGFVMNRVSGDYLETLLYKIFVSIDERTTVEELASVLDIPLPTAQNAVGIFCRLGFAHMKPNANIRQSSSDMHFSWQTVLSEAKRSPKSPTEGKTLLDFDLNQDSISIPGISSDTVSEADSTSELHDLLSMDPLTMEELGTSGSMDGMAESIKHPGVLMEQSMHEATELSCSPGKRIAFLFDSSLTAFLMMGNLSTGLKNHAVTLFEVGKLTDEALDNFLLELDKVKQLEGYEGDAHRYFEHAITLRSTIRHLRHNEQLSNIAESTRGADESTDHNSAVGLDLLRCESLKGLDSATLGRLLDKKYTLAVAMSPLSEVQEIPSTDAFHLVGPPSTSVNSVWFRLFLYQLTGSGPPTIFVPRGRRVCFLPAVFEEYEQVLVITLGHEPGEVSVSNLLVMLNEALLHSPVFVQGYQRHGFETRPVHVPFPMPAAHNSTQNQQNPPATDDPTPVVDETSLQRSDNIGAGGDVESQLDADWSSHDVVTKLRGALDLQCTCGYITLLVSTPAVEEEGNGDPKAVRGGPPIVELLNVNFGIPLFDADLNQKVCKSLVSSELFTPQRLPLLKSFNEKLRDDVNSFVETHQQKHRHPSQIAFFSQLKPNQVQFPNTLLIFDRGVLDAWDGRPGVPLIQMKLPETPDDVTTVQ